MPDEPETSEPEAEELAPEKPIDSYAGLRDDLKTQLENQYQEKMTGFLHPEPSAHFTRSAASIVAQHTYRHLPQEGEISQAQVAQAITTAQSDLADRRLWYQAVLPDDPVRIDIANRIAQRYTPDKIVTRKFAKTRGALRSAVDEYRQSVEQTRDRLPKREDLLPAVQSELQKSGITDKKLHTKQAAKIARDLDAWTFTYKAAPPPEVIQTTIQRRVGKHLEDSQDLAKRLSQNPTVSKHYEAGSHHRHLVAGGLAKTINKASSGRLVRGARKASKALNIVTRPLSYAGRGVRKVITAPVRFVTRPVGRVIKRGARRVAIGAARLVAKALVKVGLGGVVRNIERVALAGTGVGIPILVAQEAALFGAGQLFKARKSLAESWRKATQSRNVGESLLNTGGASIDTLGAGIGGIAGGTVGTGLGALGGAIIGSVVPIVGTVIGGVLGGAAGGLFGAGAGANFGAKIRKQLKRMIAMRLIFQFLKQQLLNLLQAAGRIFVGTSLGAIAGTFLIPIPIVGTIIGGVLGGIAGYLLPQAITAAKQLAFIAKHYAIQGLGQVAPLIQTGLSRAVTGARGILGIARYGPQLLVQKAAAGEGLLAQALKGIGNILSKIPSTIARGFNTATGWLSKSTVDTATSVDYVSGEILTTGPSTMLPVVSTVGVILFTLIASYTFYNYLITVFHVTPTDVVPYVEARALGSKYIGITKVACVGSLCSEDTLNLENASTGGPYTIQYTITVEALEETLSNVLITDTYAAYGDNNPTPVPPDEEWDGSITIPAGSTWEQTLTATIPRSSRWDAAALVNVVTVTATVIGESEPVQNSDSVLICIGDCPICPPTLSPLDSPYVSGYRFGSAPTNVCLNPPVEHRGIDISSSSFAVYSTFACPAVVEHIGNGGSFGYYLTLRSGPWYSFYAHMVESSSPWSVGDTIAGRQIIGVMNSTGNSSGNHVHYEIRDETLGSVNPSDVCQPPVSVNPCSWGNWGVGDAADCAI